VEDYSPQHAAEAFHKACLLAVGQPT
jgi:hypothetical protein